MFESQARGDINVQIRANRPLHFGVGLKDKPNHLVAGSLRSSTEDSLRSTVFSGGADDRWTCCF